MYFESGGLYPVAEVHDHHRVLVAVASNVRWIRFSSLAGHSRCVGQEPATFLQRRDKSAVQSRHRRRHPRPTPISTPSSRVRSRMACDRCLVVTRAGRSASATATLPPCICHRRTITACTCLLAACCVNAYMCRPTCTRSTRPRQKTSTACSRAMNATPSIAEIG